MEPHLSNRFRLQQTLNAVSSHSISWHSSLSLLLSPDYCARGQWDKDKQSVQKSCVQTASIFYLPTVPLPLPWRTSYFPTSAQHFATAEVTECCAVQPDGVFSQVTCECKDLRKRRPPPADPFGLCVNRTGCESAYWLFNVNPNSLAARRSNSVSSRQRTRLRESFKTQHKKRTSSLYSS